VRVSALPIRRRIPPKLQAVSFSVLPEHVHAPVSAASTAHLDWAPGMPVQEADTATISYVDDTHTSSDSSETMPVPQQRQAKRARPVRGTQRFSNIIRMIDSMPDEPTPLSAEQQRYPRVLDAATRGARSQSARSNRLVREIQTAIKAEYVKKVNSPVYRQPPRTTSPTTTRRRRRVVRVLKRRTGPNKVCNCVIVVYTTGGVPKFWTN
jgi:hypothetical protein